MTKARAAAAATGVLSEEISHRDRVGAEQVAALFRLAPMGVSAAAIGAVILSATLYRLGQVDTLTGVVWTSCMAACAAAHILLGRIYAHARPAAAEWRGWASAFTLISLAEGVGWGWATLWLAADGSFELDLLVFVAVFGVAAGAVAAFGAFLPAFFAIFLPATVPYALISTGAENPVQQAGALLLLVFVAVVGGLAVVMNRSFRDNVSLRLETEALAADLASQKDIAERANRAKSSFLAAASHDLRQPVHALGLFVGALRGVKRMPAEGARLIEQMEASTTALDSLFSALLDISRLDAGVVEVHQRPFQMGPLIERICRDYREEASAKGVRLIAMPCRAVVRSDPLLLERILRNLVANAVRHTLSGRVLAGCRRRGAYLQVEVWDTGPGIPSDKQELVFQEYYQLGNPERDRARGLGLGLAIVRRLTTLIGASLRLRSEVGRGSCFAIDVPLSTGAEPVGEALQQPESGALARGLVVVIDDELAIRQAMTRLLEAWGHTVVAAGGSDEAVERLAGVADRPDLIISDFRLRDGEDGIAAIELLRSEYNEAIPAMLITGDTAPDRLREAQASGLLLLHKPVPNSRLRAAIVNLMGKGR
jgi:signal transduction histidine kinase